MSAYRSAPLASLSSPLNGTKRKNASKDAPLKHSTLTCSSTTSQVDYNLFFAAFQRLDTSINAEASKVTYLGRAIGGVGAMLYLGYIGWQMQAGDRDWEITPMLRPFFIGLILLHWTSFYSLIQSPFRVVGNTSKGIFEKIEKDANVLRVKRFQKQNQLLDYMIKKEAEEKAKQKELEKLEEKSWDEKIIGTISEGWDKIKTPVEEWFIRMDFKFQRMIADVIEAVGLTILRVCTYLITLNLFLIKEQPRVSMKKWTI